MRRLKYVGTLREAFKSGYAKIAAKKISNILGRHYDVSATFGESPVEYENAYGQFAGYFIMLGTRQMIRLNFLLSKNDSIYSVDFYRSVKPWPDFTVETSGLNIMEVMGEIIANINELNESLSPSMRSVLERVDRNRRNQLFQIWVKTDPDGILDALQNKRMVEIYNNMFLQSNKNNSEIPLYDFVSIARQFLKSRGLTNKTFRKRKRGSKERPIENPEQEEALNDLVDGIGWEKKFDMIKNSVKAVTSGMVKSLILFGSPGSGKTKTVIDTLDEIKAPYKKYSGGLKSTEELVRILYNNREGMNIVFDDFDSVFKNKEMVSIFKAVLQNDPVREVSWVNLKGFTGSGKLKKASVPAKFDFMSQVIFISNLYKFDSAISSRAITLRIDLSNDDMIDKIEKTIDKFHPEIDKKYKIAAIEFLREISGGVRSIDYRKFEMCLVAQQINPSDWQDWATTMLTSV